MPATHRILPVFVPLLSLGMLAASAGCSTTSHQSETGFSYTSIPVAHESAQAGEGNHIRFRGTDLDLSGQTIGVGDTLRPVDVTRNDLSLVNVTETGNSVRVINIVPSLDTKVCEQQTHYLSEKNEGLDQQVSLITISVDTPFAQTRFADEAQIDNVLFLSDYRGGAFGQTHGLLLPGPHVLARAIMVVDQQNVIRHLQITPDLGQLPDMDAAFQEARRLVNASS